MRTTRPRLIVHASLHMSHVRRCFFQEGSSYYGYRAPLTSTLDRHTFGAGRSPSASALSSVGSVGRSQSMRRMRQHLLELEASARHHSSTLR